MIRKLHRDESGYSLVEVLMAIIILSIAIIPMVAMFDAGLRAAVLGGNYDTGRALANEELESIRALPYFEPGAPANSVREFYPPANGPSPPPGGAVPCRTTPLPDVISSCEVRTTFVSIGTTPGGAVSEDSTARSMMRVEVETSWSGGGPFKTTGIVSQETG